MAAPSGMAREAARRALRPRDNRATARHPCDALEAGGTEWAAASRGSTEWAAEEAGGGRAQTRRGVGVVGAQREEGARGRKAKGQAARLLRDGARAVRGRARRPGRGVGRLARPGGREAVHRLPGAIRLPLVGLRRRRRSRALARQPRGASWGCGADPQTGWVGRADRACEQSVRTKHCCALGGGGCLTSRA